MYSGKSSNQNDELENIAIPLEMSKEERRIPVERFYFTHNEKIENEAVWKSVVTPEIEKFLTKIIPDTGQEVLIIGSAAVVAYFGGRNPNYDKDIDVYVIDKTTLANAEKIDESEFPIVKKFRIGMSIIVGAEKIGITDFEELRRRNLDFLHQLEDSVQDEELRKKITTASAQLATMPVQDALKYTSLNSQDMLGFRLARNKEGTLDVYTVDPTNLLHKSLDQSRYYLEHGAIPHTLRSEVVENSTREIFMEVIKDKSEITLDSLVPLWFAESYPRLLAQQSELDIDPKKVIYGSPLVPNVLQEQTQRIISGELKINLTGEALQVLTERGFSEFNEYAEHLIKQYFSRASSTSTERTLKFSLANPDIVLRSISPQLAQKVEDMEVDEKGFGMIFSTLDTICDKRYPVGNEMIEHPLFPGEKFTLEKQDIYPANISEVLAVMMYSLGSRSNSNETQEIAKEISQNWRPKNRIALQRANDNVEIFDMKLDQESIITEIERLEKIYG